MVAFEEWREWGDEGKGVSKISPRAHFYIMFWFWTMQMYWLLTKIKGRDKLIFFKSQTNKWRTSEEPWNKTNKHAKPAALFTLFSKPSRARCGGGWNACPHPTSPAAHGGLPHCPGDFHYSTRGFCPPRFIFQHKRKLGVYILDP